MTIRRFAGSVVDRDTRAGEEGLWVEALVCGAEQEEVLAAARSGRTRGDFVLELDSAFVDELYPQGAPTVFFRVSDGTSVYASTERTRTWSLARDGRGDIAINRTEPIGKRSGPPTQTVLGTVAKRTGTTLADGLTVTVFVRKLDASGGVVEEPMATTTSGPHGAYAVSFSLSGDATLKPDLVVRAFNGEDEVGSGTLCAAPRRAIVDVVTMDGAPGERHPGLPAYWSAVGKVNWVLGEAGRVPALDAASVQDEALDYLACRAEVDRAELEAVVQGARLAAAHPAVSEEAFYGLLSGGISAEDALYQPRSMLQAVLADAAKERRVSPSVADELESVLDELREAGVAELSIAGGPSRPFTPMGQLAALTPGIDSTKRDALVRHGLDNEGSADTFWLAVGGDTATFDGPTVASLKFTADIAPLVAGWPDMIERLHVERLTLATGHARELAQLDVAGWLSLIDEASPPTGVTAEGYAAAILDAVEQRYRTAFIGYRQAGSTLAFFTSATNAGFDFRKHRVARYLAETPAALAGIPSGDHPAVIAELKKLERLFKITSSWAEMSALLGAPTPITSAAAAHALGPDRLAAQTGLSLAVAADIVDRACWSTWTAIGIHSKYAPALQSHLIASGVLPDKVTSLISPPKIPDWSTLFGSGDGCACDHCRSVLSPSAYLVDVLQFLDRLGSGATTGKTTLLDRRPDLARLALSCENTDTRVPYVDLVNEILEVKIAVGTGDWPSTPTRVDTERTSEELSAQPELFYPAEHVAAYTTLATEIYPLSMPFHLYAKEARIYLEHLGVPRHALLRAFAGTPGPDRRLLAIERLDLAPKLYDLIADVAPVPAVHDAWGMLASPPFDEQLRAVPTLLRRGRMSHDDLLELLNSEVGAGIGFTENTCALEDQVLTTAADADWFGAVHKLLRMRIATGWSLSTLSKSRTAFPSSWDGWLRALGGIHALAARTGRDVVELLGWYATIDHWPPPAQVPLGGERPEPSLFAKLFLNKTVLNPDETAMTSIWGGGTGGTVADRALALIAALRISQADFELLTKSTVALSELALDVIQDGAAVANLATISRVVRSVGFAKAAKLTVRDSMILRALDGRPALLGDAGYVDAETAIEDALALLDVADRVRATGASLEEIHFVTRHVASPASGFVPTEETIAQWLDTIDTIIESALAESEKIEDPSGELLEKLAPALIPSPSDAADVIALGEAPIPTGNSVVGTVLARFLEDAATAKVRLVTGTGADLLTDPAERRAYLTSRLYRHAAIAGAVKTFLAATFSLSTEAVDWVLERGGLVWDAAAPAVLAFTRQPDWVDVPLPTPEVRRDLLLRLHKLGLLAARFDWTEVDVRALFPTTGRLPVLDLSALPVERPSSTAPGDARARFEAWLGFAEARSLRDAWGGGREAFYAYLASGATATLSEMQAGFAAATGFNVEDVAAAGAALLGGPTTYRAPTLLVRLRDALAICRRLGSSAAQVTRWIGSTLYDMPTSPDLESPAGNAYVIAAEIKRAAKGKHGDEAWAEIAKPLRDVLRERQRSTLVDAILARHPTWESPNDVYANLLVDVEMSPCQLTSRMVLAHATVQLFMQRILLHLESGLEATEDAASEWRWMKAYRVWEANRKVFLWPENWIEPELRDDKSPLFKALETKLLQGPLDREAAEDAYRSYLEGLGDIARLDIVALHYENPTDADSPLDAGYEEGRVLHVFGRSRTNQKHFYRKREAGTWSPWEKLDIDIDSDHLVPVTLGGRLYILYPQWNTRAIPTDDPQADQKQEEELGIRIAVTERRGNGWTPPLMGPADFVWLGGKPDKERLSFTWQVGEDEIILKLLARSDGKNATYQVARFGFYPGTGAVTWNVLDPLGPPNDGEVHPAINTPAHVVKVVPPRHTKASYQRWATRDGAVPLSVAMPRGDTPGTIVRHILGANLPPFVVTAERKAEPVSFRNAFFFDDGSHTIFFEHKRKLRGALQPAAMPYKHTWALASGSHMANAAVPTTTDSYYRAELHEHPYVASFRTALAIGGVDGLLRWPDQGSQKLQKQSLGLSSYMPFETVQTPFPKASVDFQTGPYALYNWELFFHAPLLIANRLSQEGRYEEAQRWYHYIFDPTDGTAGPAPKRYWKFVPFHENASLADIQADLEDLALDAGVELDSLADPDEITATADSLAAQIEKWRSDPFDPHAIARLRLVAYQKAVVLKYIENILAWADQLFSQDTMESINEATQLYILAQELLGERPARLKDPTPPGAKAYGELGTPDLFGNFITELEHIIPPRPKHMGLGARGRRGCKRGVMPPQVVGGTLYFCVPPNEKLLGLFDVVADRLFKIRHCMNIEGTVRALPLFQPPIDPALLVRAVAAGIDIASVLNDVNVAAPPYRYGVLYPKALDMAGSVTALGASLLSALEKADAEHLGNLRAQHEIAINEMMRETRKRQVDDAKQSIHTLEQQRKGAQQRLDYYGSRQLIFPGEAEAIALQEEAHLISSVGEGLRTMASVLHMIPNISAGFPCTAVETGGTSFGNSFDALAGVTTFVASELTFQATMTEKNESYKRRKEDWDQQAKLARIEVDQIDREILGAQIKLQIAENDLATLDKQLEQSREIEAFLRTKFTNEDLYGWMKGQLAALYYQAYKLAYEMARRAERAFQYERGDKDQSFIQFGYWDGLKQGLLAGEKLAHDLRRMDAAYVSQNKRELEIVKMVSLAEHAPDELAKLRNGDAASFSLTEDDYDRDFSDHYLRRLRSVAVTIPCTAGPYQGVHGTLDVLQGATRPTATATTMDVSSGALQSIVTSQAQQDAGMFELSFRDDRLLPFEGVGAHLDLGASGPQFKFTLSTGNRFAYTSIDDLVLDIRYTARRSRSVDLPSGTRSLFRLVRIRAEHDLAWQAFKDGEADGFTLSLPPESWPAGRNETLDSIEALSVHAWWTAKIDTLPAITLTPPSGTATPGSPNPATDSKYAKWAGTAAISPFPTGSDWTLAFTSPTSTVRDKLDEVWLVLRYVVTIAVA